MGPLRPMYTAKRTVPYIMHFTDKLIGIQVKLLNPDIVITIIAAALRIGMGSDIIAFSVIIKEKAGINAVCSLQIMGL